MLPSMLENIWVNLLVKNWQITAYVDPQMTRIPEGAWSHYFAKQNFIFWIKLFTEQKLHSDSQM